MESKLTLRLGEGLIDQAKKLAKRNGTSISKMVAGYFHSLASRLRSKRMDKPLTPLVASLRGSLRNRYLQRKDYRRYLEQKYL